MYSLVLGENNGKFTHDSLYRVYSLFKLCQILVVVAADSTRAMQEQMQMSGAGMPPDPAKAFKVNKRVTRLQISVGHR